MKKCSICENLKPLNNFSKNKYRADGYRSNCKICDSLSYKKWLSNNKEKRQNCRLKSRYGITLKEYTKLKLKQNNCCKICKKEEKLVVDHCHTTKKVRGLLCTLCNKGLGHFYDNISLFERAIQYIKENHVSKN